MFCHLFLPPMDPGRMLKLQIVMYELPVGRALLRGLKIDFARYDNNSSTLRLPLS